MGESLTRDEAVEKLAKELHWKMEHLDPTEESEWGGMDEERKNLPTFGTLAFDAS